MHQANPDGFKEDSTNLIQESHEDKVDFTKGGQGNTDDNQGDISKFPEINGLDLKDPTSDKDCDRSECLMNICQIGNDGRDAKLFAGGVESRKGGEIGEVVLDSPEL